VVSEGGERRALGGVPREQKMLKGHLPRVTYHQVHLYTKIGTDSLDLVADAENHREEAHGVQERAAARLHVYRGTVLNLNYVTEMCSGSEAGSYLRLIDCLCHSTLGLRVIKKKKSIEVCSRKSILYQESAGSLQKWPIGGTNNRETVPARLHVH